MNVTIGLDIGVNSIGWVVISEDENRIIGMGVHIYPLSAKKTPPTSFKIMNIIRSDFLKSHCLGILWSYFSVCIIALVFNSSNWQFWLNSVLTAILTILNFVWSTPNKNRQQFL